MVEQQNGLFIATKCSLAIRTRQKPISNRRVCLYRDHLSRLLRHGADACHIFAPFERGRPALPVETKQKYKISYTVITKSTKNALILALILWNRNDLITLPCTRRRLVVLTCEASTMMSMSAWADLQSPRVISVIDVPVRLCSTTCILHKRVLHNAPI